VNKIRTLPLYVFLFLFTFPRIAHAQAFTVEHACQPDETWSFQDQKKQFFTSDHPVSDLVKEFYPLMMNSQKEWAPGAREYFTGRFFYNQGLIDLAFEHWLSALNAVTQIDGKSSLSATLAPQFAAVQCLTQIQSQYPELKASTNVVSPLAMLLKNQSTERKLLNSSLENYYLLLLVRKQILESDYPQELSKKPIHRSALHLTLALNEALQHQSGKTTQALTSALAEAARAPFNPVSAPLTGLAKITLGRLLYTTEKYKDSLRWAQAILKEHPSDSGAMELASWNHYQLKELDSSIEESFTLRTPGLKNFFSPMTELLPVMIYLDNCHYQEAKAQLDYYRNKYRTENEYLSAAHAHPSADLFSTLNGKKQLVSSKTMAAWLQSPTTLSLLVENNLLVDEIHATKALNASLKLMEKNYSRFAFFSPIESQLKSSDANFSSRSQSTLTRLDSWLQQKTEEMKSEISSAAQNAALMEADVLLGTSQSLSQDQGDPSKVETRTNRTLSSDTTPKWSWGEKDTTHMENDESWADELGSLNSEVKNACH